MADYTVKPGDCFNSIAAANGFYNYLTLYNHGDNATLKGKRTNPNMLVEGDVVKIPDKTQKKVALTLDGEKKFVVDRQTLKARLKVTGADNKPLTVTATQLTVGSASTTTAPDATGLVELVVPAADKSGMLKLTVSMPLNAPAAPAAAAPAVATPPPNPPVIDPAAFTDVLEAPSTDNLDLTWNLKIGCLEPASEIRGDIQRLNNLGVKTPDPATTKAENDDTARVVKSYQTFLKKTVTGKLDDLRADLETAHDKV